MTPPVAQLPQWLRATLRLRELMLDGELRCTAHCTYAWPR